MKKTLLSLIMILLLCCINMGATIRYVSMSGNDANDGLSWATAKASLYRYSGSDTVFVAVGVYNPVDITSSIIVYGGFSGNESSLAERPELINGVRADGNATVIDGMGTSNYGIEYSGNYRSILKIDGIVIRNCNRGLAISSNSVSGLSIFNNMTIENNNQGCYMNGGTLSNSLIRNNGLVTPYPIGGIRLGSGAPNCITNCNIINNVGVRVGGISSTSFAPGSYLGSDVIIDNCLIANNKTVGNDGYAGGVYLYYYDLCHIENSIVINNHCAGSTGNLSVGGIYAAGYNGVDIRGCLVANNTVVHQDSLNLTFSGVYLTSAYSNKISNSTIVANSTLNVPTGYRSAGMGANGRPIINCVVWNNQYTTDSGQVYKRQIGSIPTSVNYSAIEGGYASAMSSIALDSLNMGSDSTLLYPGFINPSGVVGSAVTAADSSAILNANWGLQSTSPLIDGGSPATYLTNWYSTKDAYGFPRITNNRIDIGALEFIDRHQSINWDQTLQGYVGDTLLLTATASSGLAVSYSVQPDTSAIIIGDTLVLLQAGAITITASQAGNDVFYTAADVVKQMQVVQRVEQLLTWNQLLTGEIGDTLILTATASSGLAVSYESSNSAVAQVQHDTLIIMGEGSVVITASQHGDSLYLPAVALSKNLEVTKQQQAIIWTQQLQGMIGDTILLSATATSGLVVSYVSDNSAVALIQGNRLILTGEGNASITANQVGSNKYHAATSVTKEVTVARQTQAIIWVQTLQGVIGDNVTLSATATSGLRVSYSSDNSSVAIVNGNQLIVVGEGDAIITASQAGNAYYSPATSVSKTIHVERQAQAILWQQELKATVNDEPITLLASATSGLSIIYSSDNTSVAIVNRDQLTIVGVGSATIRAEQHGDAMYLPADHVEKTIEVSPAVGLAESELITLSVYPNPVTEGEFTITTSSTEAGLIQIYTVQGTLVHQEQVSERDVVISCHDWAKGIYLVRVADKVEKIVIK